MKLKSIAAISLSFGLCFSATILASTALPWDSRNTLMFFTNKDMEVSGAAADKVLQAKKIGATETWRNDDTGRSGSVKLLKKFVQNGKQCRSLEYKVSKAHDSAVFNMDQCLQADNQWKFE